MEVKSVKYGHSLDISFMRSSHSSPIYWCEANYDNRHVHWDMYIYDRDLVGDSIVVK
jgi:hypothetical protein